MSDMLTEALEIAEFTLNYGVISIEIPSWATTKFDGWRSYRESYAMGMEVRSGIAETGVIGVLEGGRPSPVVLLRFDMDALPVQEQNELSTLPSRPGSCMPDGTTDTLPSG